MKTQLITALLFCPSHKPLQNQVWHLPDILSFTEDKATAVVLFYAMQFNVFLLKITLLEFVYLLSSFLGLYFKAFSILIGFFMKNYSTLGTETFHMFLTLKHKWCFQSHNYIGLFGYRIPASHSEHVREQRFFVHSNRTCNDFCSSQDLKKAIELIK